MNVYSYLGGVSPNSRSSIITALAACGPSAALENLECVIAFLNQTVSLEIRTVIFERLAWKKISNHLVNDHKLTLRSKERWIN